MIRDLIYKLMRSMYYSMWLCAMMLTIKLFVWSLTPESCLGDVWASVKAIGISWVMMTSIGVMGQYVLPSDDR